jgi:formylmethanofuran dehydrogenase subunit E
MDEEFKKAAEFHGHECPGLAIGYRVAKYVKGNCNRSEDEELVAIVENNSCSVDAIQQMLGCTFGKGNLIFKDYGKQVFTFYCRGDGNATRIYFKGKMPKRMGELQEKRLKNNLTAEEQREIGALREQFIKHILSASDDELLSIKKVPLPEPEKARIYPSRSCENCQENFMEIKGRVACGKVVCMDCFGKLADKCY